MVDMVCYTAYSTGAEEMAKREVIEGRRGGNAYWVSSRCPGELPV